MADPVFPSSLPDDTYELLLDCNAIMDVNGRHLLNDDEDPADGYYTIKFHRLFGDADGSAKVDFLDMSRFALHWLDTPVNTGLDSNENDVLDFPDFAAFAVNWLRNYP